MSGDERKGPKYTFTADGAELTGPDAEDLEKEFNTDPDSPPQTDDFLPGRPVKLNEAWTIEAGKFAAAFEKGTPIRLDAELARVAAFLGL